MIPQLLTDNPYRMLGVCSNAPRKEILTNLNRMKAFLKVGKPVSFNHDMTALLPPVQRNEETVTAAQSSVELPMDQIANSLFWFANVTATDAEALRHLEAGDLAQGKALWEKEDNVSALVNRMACALIEGDSDALAKAADNLFSNYSAQYCAMINETVNLSGDELTALFAEKLKQDGTFDLSRLGSTPGTSDCWHAAFSANVAAPLIARIDRAIEKSEEARGPEGNYRAGMKLYEETKDLIAQLKEELGEDDMQYEMEADKLGKTILQHAINYYNTSDDSDRVAKARRLQNLVADVAAGEALRARLQSNAEILENTIVGMASPEVEEEASAIDIILREYSAAPPELESAEYMLSRAKPYLAQMKEKVGLEDAGYLQISDIVAAAALNNVINKINSLSGLAPFGANRDYTISVINHARDIMLSLDCMDITQEFYDQRYARNRYTIEEMYDKANGIEEQEAQSSGSGGAGWSILGAIAILMGLFRACNNI